MSDEVELVKWYKKHYKVELYGGSLVHDMCMLSMCDGLVISNSSFGAISAVLNTCDYSKIYRPSVYPIGRCNALGKNMNYPTDCFMPGWQVIKTRQDLKSYWYISNIRNIFYRCIRVLGRIKRNFL